MLRQDREPSLKWHNLALPLFLPILVTLLLLYLLSPQRAVAPILLPLETSRGPGENLIRVHAVGTMVRQVAREGGISKDGSPAKGKGSTGSQANPPYPLCHTPTPSPTPPPKPSPTPSPTPTSSPTPTLPPKCKLTLKATPLSQTIPPGALAIYELTAKNANGCDGTLTLTATSQQGWEIKVSPSSPIVLPAGRRVTAILTHTLPPCTLSGTVDVATVKATLDCGSCDTPDSRTVALTTTAERVSGIDLSPDRFASAAAGETVFFTHTLTHSGNYTDDLSFEVTSTLGWPIAPPPTTSVGPCNSTIVPLRVDVPLSAKKGQTNAIVITAGSTLYPGVHDAVTDTIEVLTPCCAVDLNAVPPVQSAMPGETVTYTLTVSNAGVHTGTAGIETDPPAGWPPPTLLPPPANTLLPKESTVWRMRLTVPPDASPGSRRTHVTALLTCTAVPTTALDSASLTTTVISTPAAAIEPGVIKTIQVTEDMLHNGTEITFTHRITNTGTLTDVFTFDVHSAQGWTVTAPLSGTWKSGQSKDMAFSITVPPGVSTVSDTLVITVTPTLAPARYATATDKIRDGRVFLPIIMKNFCRAIPLCNGDFETGNLSCWSRFPYYYGAKNELPVQVVPDPSGGYWALLGSLDFQCWQGVPTGRAWMTQTFGVPSYGHPQLSFRYEMHTQHTIYYDTFEVFLETQGKRYQILKVGQPPPKSGCKEKPHTIAGTCTIDLANPTDCEGNPIDADFICKHITLRFENWNRVLIYYNTWTYVDDVAFTW